MSHMYTFIRTDLSIAQQIVQHGHATYAIGTNIANNCIPSIVLIGTNNEDGLLKISQFLIDHHIKHKMFFEPDINQYTSIATIPVHGDDRKLFRKFKLLK